MDYYIDPQKVLEEIRMRRKRTKQVRITEKYHKRLKFNAKLLNTSMKELIDVMCEQYLVKEYKLPSDDPNFSILFEGDWEDIFKRFSQE